MHQTTHCLLYSNSSRRRTFLSSMGFAGYVFVCVQLCCVGFHCLSLHVSAYMAIFKCVGYFIFICLKDSASLLFSTWSHCTFPFVFLSSPNHIFFKSRPEWLLPVPCYENGPQRGHVSQPWRTSNRTRHPNSGRYRKKPSTSASNNGRINGARVLLWKSLSKHCRMFYSCSAMPPSWELSDCPSYL
jgi:hypothetical protein